MNKIQIYPSVEDVIQQTAGLFVKTAAETIQQKDVFSVGLSGGSTPQPLYTYLAENPAGDILDWNKIHFFWGDERAVPLDHPDSNFRQVNHALLQPLHIPPENIHRVQGELDPATAAMNYQQEILNWFEVTPPRFDLILLGMGSDGHTASLFPGTEAIINPPQNHWVIPNFIPHLSTWRITFLPELINAAAQVIYLVTGQSKAETLLTVLEGEYLPERYPSQLIKPDNGSLVWIIDQAAGDLLSTDQR
jgi:6-phosphogluconolactonase